METAYIVDAVRTPMGRHGGGLADVRPDDLAAHALRSLISRVPEVPPEAVDDVLFGNANGAGEDNRNVARMAALLAGMPVTTPGATVTRLCGSGLEAVVNASRAIEVGDAKVVVAGGVESMSRAPWILLKPAAPYSRDHATLHSSTIGWRMVNPAMPDKWTGSLGEGAELLADLHGISREEQDAFALRSHRRAADAWGAGRFDNEVVEVAGLMRDECVRPDVSATKLAGLRPAFRPNGSVTAGNSSPLNDGAAAMMLVGEAVALSAGRRPLARIAGRGVAGVDPAMFGIGPVAAAEVALERAGVGWDDLAAVELNEAFAAQALACLAGWPQLDPEIVNVNGGAIALGHPLGCSGTRILTTLAWELHRRGGGYGLATMCIGVGQGIAVVIEAEG